jgi:hypothetical protein
MRPRGRIEADGGGGSEIETFSAPVDRNRDSVVGKRGDLIGKSPGLVPEQPSDLSRQLRHVVEQIELAGTICS